MKNARSFWRFFAKYFHLNRLSPHLTAPTQEIKLSGDQDARSALVGTKTTNNAKICLNLIFAMDKANKETP